MAQQVSTITPCFKILSCFWVKMLKKLRIPSQKFSLEEIFFFHCLFFFNYYIAKVLP